MSITQNQIRASYTSLIAVSASAPSSFLLGDIYYNTTTHLVYTAISDTEGGTPYWGEGEAPIENHLYCDINANVFYGVDNGVLFANIGTGDVTNPLNNDLNANNHKVTNLPNGIDPQDAVTKSQLDAKADLANVILSSEKGVANGVATLDTNGIVPNTQLPIATSQNVGLVQPDGTTTTVDSSGVISAVQPDIYRPPLLSFIWSDHIINQVSWLRADTFSWQSGAVYTAAYDHLVNEITPVNTDFVYNPTIPFLIDQRTSYRISRISYRNSAYDYTSNGATYYAWSFGDTLNTFGILVDGWFTTTETPQANDTIYVADLESMSDGVQATSWSLGVSNQVYCDNIDNIHFPVYYRATDGHKICINEDYANALYNYNGVSWYFVLDTANTRFKLPRTKFGFTGYRNGVGDYVKADALLPNITGNFYAQADYTQWSEHYSGAFKAGSNVGRRDSGASDWHEYPTLDFDASLCSDVYSGTDSTIEIQPPATQMHLYFYVGNFAETAIEQTAGLNANLFNTKADIDLSNIDTTIAKLNAALPNGIDYVVESQLPTSSNNYTWYRKYRSGWVEQGGIVSTDNTNNQSVNLVVTMADINYNIIVYVIGQYTNWPCVYSGESGQEPRTTTSFSFVKQYGNKFSWEVKGQGA